MAQIFGRAGQRRRASGGTFPCPRCGKVRPYDVVRSRGNRRGAGAMRCQVCEATYDAAVEGQQDLQLVAEWNHRVDRLVATVGIAGRRTADGHAERARTYLLSRGWFTAEVDSVVGWASEVSPKAAPDLVDELVMALELLRSVTRTSGMELVVVGLIEILTVDGSLDKKADTLVARCADAAGVDRAKLDEREAVAA